VPVFEQYVLAEFLNSGELERYLNRRRRKLRQERD
jgi:GntR family transcriptional regulator/MocR family aminotransferase